MISYRDLGRGPNQQAPAAVKTLRESYQRVTGKPFIDRSLVDDEERSKVINAVLAKCRAET
jgi:hypothetical protein